MVGLLSKKVGELFPRKITNRTHYFGVTLKTTEPHLGAHSTERQKLSNVGPVLIQ